MNEKFSKLGFYPADILLPNKDVDMEKWAVVACDQFTSEPEYWERVEKTVGDAPSTLRLILPEANLKAPNVDEFITVPDPKVQLAVGTLQAFIDEYLKKFGGEVDYIHGDEVTRELGSKEGNMGFLLPAMGKEQLFKTVMADGVLPRKTFSMGHAQDKRYYVEARKIR